MPQRRSRSRSRRPARQGRTPKNQKARSVAMAEATLVQDGIDRVETALRSLNGEIQRLQKDWSRRRRSFERQAQKRVDRFLVELRRSPVVKRAQTLRRQAQRRLDTRVETLLGSLRVASQNDIARLDRKLNAINKKLREMEEARPTRARA